METTLTGYVLSLLLALPAYRGDNETAQTRLERIRLVASATSSAAMHASCLGPWKSADWCVPVWHRSPFEISRLLITIGHFESNFAEHVHANRCRLNLGECDADKVNGRWVATAVGPWQTKLVYLAPDERRYVATGATEHGTYVAAYAAARIVSRAYDTCRSIVGALALYGTGRACVWSGAVKRTEFFDMLGRKVYHVDAGGLVPP